MKRQTFTVFLKSLRHYSNNKSWNTLFDLVYDIKTKN